MYRPASEHARADLLFGIGPTILRVQCKTAVRREATLVVNTVTCRRTPAGYARRSYGADEIDLVAAFDPASERSYLLPIELVEGRTAISLRLQPARNGQRAGLHYAADYEFQGAVAQLGERRHGMAEVRGSSPLSSTSPGLGDSHEATTVGAHEFRNRFGWYLERAAAGETIHVTRRGRPHVELRPSLRQLELAEAPSVAQTGANEEAEAA